MLKNYLTPNNLRWLTACLFLLLMVLLLAFNLFVQPGPGASATNSTPTAQSGSEINCQQVLHLSCTDVISTATAKVKAKHNKAPTATPTPSPTPLPTHTPTPTPKGTKG